MSRPQRHPKTGVFYYRRAIPGDLRKFYSPRPNGKGPWEEKRSLGTKDAGEARVRHAQVAAEIEAKWAGFRAGRVVLTQKQITALAGEAYRELVQRFRDEPNEASFWETLLKVKAGVRSEKRLEQWVGVVVDELLESKGLLIDAESRARLLVAYHGALMQAMARLKRHAEGDYTPDPLASRFPEFEAVRREVPQTATDGVSLRGLLEGWWAEARQAHIKPSTYAGYRTSVEKLIRFVGHDDASRITSEDVVAFKDARLKEINSRNGKPISAKTVKDCDLAGLRSVLKWGVTNKRLSINAAQGITIKLGKPPKLRNKGFTDEEAIALLTAAHYYAPGREHPKLASAKRWVFWVCAYTGARLGEIVQLRREDVRKEGNLWVIQITPSAGTVKTNEARDVPLHPHLVELGFPAFVKASDRGHLFITPHATNGFVGPWRTAKNRLIEMARKIVTDPNVPPTHGWRHRWKTLARAARIDKEMRDYIQGHAAGDVAAGYGGHWLTVLAEEIAKIPAVVIPPKPIHEAAPKAQRRRAV